MTEVEVPKFEIAREYLDRVIEFFLAGTNYFSAIHLSAAAEELLGAHLSEDKRISTFAWKAEKALMSETGSVPKDAAARRGVNEWKNNVKHMDDGTSPTILIDPAFAAEHHIEQALVNFYKLNLRKSAAVSKFETHQNLKLDKLRVPSSLRLPEDGLAPFPRAWRGRRDQRRGTGGLERGGQACLYGDPGQCSARWGVAYA